MGVEAILEPRIRPALLDTRLVRAEFARLRSPRPSVSGGGRLTRRGISEGKTGLHARQAV